MYVRLAQGMYMDGCRPPHTHTHTYMRRPPNTTPPFTNTVRCLFGEARARPTDERHYATKANISRQRSNSLPKSRQSKQTSPDTHRAAPSCTRIGGDGDGEYEYINNKQGMLCAIGIGRKCFSTDTGASCDTALATANPTTTTQRPIL